MTGYYDIHTHILPNVDDGARDIEETRKMLYLAYEEGIRHIVATPHFALDGKNVPVEELQRKFEEVKRMAGEVLPEMTFSLGNELLNSPGMVEALNEGRALTLGGTRYILVEFLPRDSYSGIYSSLRNYIINGYIPIVAHMERYEALLKKYSYIRELIQLGVFFQMNTDSLTGGIFQRDAVYHRRLLEEGYIHFLGSDCHRKDRRPPLMKSALRHLRKNFPDGDIETAVLVKNPADMLADKYI